MPRKLILPTALLALTACGGETRLIGPGEPPRSTLTAKIDGRLWTPSFPSVSLSGTTLQLSGYEPGRNGEPSRRIAVIARGVTGPGTYDLGPAAPDSHGTVTFQLGFSADYRTSDRSPYASAVIVTTFDENHLEGTFYFTAEGTASAGVPTPRSFVTDGAFAAEF